MWKDEEFSDILHEIFTRQLGQAVKSLENYLLVHPLSGGQDSLQTLRSEYTLLMDYWKKGFVDPQRDNLYNQLLRRLYMLVADALFQKRIGLSSVLSTCYQRSRIEGKDWAMATIKEQLEAYVSNVAMLELEPEHVRQKKGETIYVEHQKYMSQLFCYLLTSPQLSESAGEAMGEVLLSPTVDVFDQQLMISALTISCMSVFDLTKFKMFVNVYQHAADENLRQRALVGLAFSLSKGVSEYFPEVTASVRQLCADESFRRELTELQIQMVYCMDTDDDSRYIKDEIMPDLIKGNNLQVTRKGLVEIEEDQLENILHPETAEQDMEKMEDSMRKMADMQRRGSDIYYAGFSQMKRYPFFNDLSNWFVPFYPQHPSISKIWEQSKGQKFLRTITSLGAFCDSDKYSFVLAFNEVLSHLPEQMLKMIDSGEAAPMAVGGEVPFEEQRNPAFRRRVYLQSLYRFFRLFPQRAEFCNPFEREKVIFFCNPAFTDADLSKEALEIASFLSKKKKYQKAVEVLDIVVQEKRDAEYCLMMGNLKMHLGINSESERFAVRDYYAKALELLNNSQDDKIRERALKGYARALFSLEQYEEALKAYDQLLIVQPDNRYAQLNSAVCLVNLDRYEEALKLLYKLNYENEQDDAVNRVLAWALTLSEKYDQAAKIYGHLLTQDTKNPADLLNYGYCMWFRKDITGAVSLFRQYVNSEEGGKDNLKDDFLSSEHDLIVSRGISDIEILLMLDAVSS